MRLGKSMGLLAPPVPGFPSVERPPKIEVSDGQPQPTATKYGLTYDIPAGWLEAEVDLGSGRSAMKVTLEKVPVPGTAWQVSNIIESI